MTGSFLRKNTKNKLSSSVKTCNNKSNYVIIDGFLVSRSRRVTICSHCANTYCTNNNNRICTSAGYWHDLKKKYEWKIMGRRRLIRWIHKQNTIIN